MLVLLQAILGDKHLDYACTLNLMGRIHSDKANHVEALRCFDQFAEIQKVRKEKQGDRAAWRTTKPLITALIHFAPSHHRCHSVYSCRTYP